MLKTLVISTVLVSTILVFSSYDAEAKSSKYCSPVITLSPTYKYDGIKYKRLNGALGETYATYTMNWDTLNCKKIVI